MVHRMIRSALLLSLGMHFAACSSGNDVTNASPRITDIPQQTTTGGTTFTLDLSTYVADREGGTLTYGVTSGGGSFTGSTYSSQFDTMGAYPVTFTVDDGSKVSTGTFNVRVTTANLAIVEEDATGLLLLDTATNALVRVAGQASVQDPFGLSDGRLGYHLGVSTQKRLWLFDPMTRASTSIAPTAAGATSYVAHTNHNQILYTIDNGSTFSLHLYNPTTTLTRSLTEAALSTVSAMVNSDDLVYYERAVSGQSDIYGYDVAVDESFAIGTAATDEQLLAVLPNGAVVFSRLGASGERDLFYYRVASGLVEIGADNTALDLRDKTWCGHGSGSQVVFQALNGSDQELFYWNPANGHTTTILAGADTDFDGIGAGNEVVYTEVVSSTEHDIRFHDMDDDTASYVLDTSGVAVVYGIANGGSTNWAIVHDSGSLNDALAISLIATPGTQTYTGGATVVPGGILTNGDVVVQLTGGGAVCRFDAAAGTWDAAITGTGMDFCGDGIDDGDFVFTDSASGSLDLSMWDESAAGVVVVADSSDDEYFGCRTADGTLLYTRIVSPNTNSDLYVWDTATSTRLTDEDAIGHLHDYSPTGIYAGTR